MSAEMLAAKLGVRCCLTQRLLNDLLECLFDLLLMLFKKGKELCLPPELELFSGTGKKALYVTCVKVSHMNSLEGLKDLYKAPIEKRSGDLQWRIVHGLIATNRHRAHLDPQMEVKEMIISCSHSLKAAERAAWSSSEIFPQVFSKCCLLDLLDVKSQNHTHTYSHSVNVIFHL